MPKREPKQCPECGRQFQGNGWDGIDAHWKARHEAVMPYSAAWPLIRAGTYRTTKLDASARLARLEQLVRDLGLDPMRDDLAATMSGVSASTKHPESTGPATDAVEAMDAAIEGHRKGWISTPQANAKIVSRK